MCICIYVCMYVCMYQSKYTYAYIYIYIYIYIFSHVPVDASLSGLKAYEKAVNQSHQLWYNNPKDVEMKGTRKKMENKCAAPDSEDSWRVL